MIKILSIDWDYFMDTDINTRLSCFPDGGVEYNLKLSNMIWANYYIKNIRKKIESVKLSQDFLYLIEWIRKNDLSNAKFYLSPSHVSILNMIENENIKEEIDLINIDFHHDTYNHSKERNCGNWLDVLCKDYKVNAKWLRHKDSDLLGKKEDVKELLDIKIINDFQPDYIFLCKSYPWAPPHLDKYFEDLCFEFFNSCNEPYFVFGEVLLENRYKKVLKEAEKREKIM